MSKFVLTAQLQLQAPTNTQQVINQIRGQLQGAINIPVNVQGSVQAAKQINQVNQAAQKATTAGERMGKAFGASIKRFAAFNIATRAVGLFASKLSQAVDESIKFQRELVKISQVTGKTTGELQGLTDTITRLSTTLGVSSTSLLQTGRILAQAGIQAGDLKVALQALAKTTLAPTFDDITETAEGAVAILAQFGEGVGALEKQLGAINAVAGKFAVESADLISVVRRTGGVFRQAGGDLNELLALFTSVRATTRENAESIATGLRTIFTRIQRPQTIEYLKQFGVQLTDLNGRFVGPYEAVRQLSAALAGLAQGDIRFVQIAEELGGFRQIGKVIPLIQKFEVAERARQAAIAGGNSLTKDAETAQEALAVQIEKTREKFLALIRSISETSTFQIMIKSLLGIANAFIKVAESIKPLLPLIAAFAAVKFTRGLGTFVSGIGAGLRGKNQGGKIHAFASGGFVPGTGNRDTVPAMLTPGEFVIRKSSVNKIGTGTLTAMNTKGYKDGGLVEINPNASGKAIQVIVNERSNVADASAIPPISINLPQGKDSPAKQFSSEALKIAGIDKLGFSTPLTVSGFNDSNFEKAKLSIQDTINNTIDSLSEQAKAIGGSGINLKKTKEKIKKSFRTGIGRIFEEYITDLARIDSPGSRNFDILPVTDPAKKNKIGGLSTIEAYNPSNYGEIKLQESVGQFQDIIKKAANQGFFNEAIKKRIPRKRSGDGEQKAAAPKTNKALGGKIHQFATGGFVPGTGNRDTVPAMLTPGEFVIRKSSVNKIGVDNLAAMNVKGYNGGGYVSALSDAGRATPQFKRYLQDVRGFSNSEARSDKIAASVAEEYKQDFEKWQDAQKKVKADEIKRKEVSQANALKQEFPGGVFKTIPGTIGAFYLNPAQGKDDAFASRSRREFKLNGQDAVLLSGSQASGFSPGKRDLEKSSALAGMVRTNVQSAIDTGLRSIVPNFANTLDVGPIDVQSTQFEESIHRASTDKNIVSTTSGFMFEGIIDAITGAAIKGGRANFDFNRSSIQAGESKLNQMFGSDAVGALYAADAKFSAARRTDVFKKAVNSIKNGNGNLIGTAIQQFADGGIADFKPSLTVRSRGGYGDVGRKKQYLAQMVDYLKQNVDSLTPEMQQQLKSMIARQKSMQSSRTQRFSKRLGFATGGSVSDTVPAMLTPGEFVVNKKAAQSIGYGNLNRMNKQGVVGYAKGGPVQYFANGSSGEGVNKTQKTFDFESGPSIDMSSLQAAVNQAAKSVQLAQREFDNTTKRVADLNADALALNSSLPEVQARFNSNAATQQELDAELQKYADNTKKLVSATSAVEAALQNLTEAQEKFESSLSAARAGKQSQSEQQVKSAEQHQRNRIAKTERGGYLGFEDAIKARAGASTQVSTTENKPLASSAFTASPNTPLKPADKKTTNDCRCEFEAAKRITNAIGQSAGKIVGAIKGKSVISPMTPSSDTVSTSVEATMTDKEIESASKTSASADKSVALLLAVPAVTAGLDQMTQSADGASNALNRAVKSIGSIATSFIAVKSTFDQFAPSIKTFLKLGDDVQFTFGNMLKTAFSKDGLTGFFNNIAESGRPGPRKATVGGAIGKAAADAAGRLGTALTKLTGRFKILTDLQAGLAAVTTAHTTAGGVSTGTTIAEAAADAVSTATTAGETSSRWVHIGAIIAETKARLLNTRVGKLLQRGWNQLVRAGKFLKDRLANIAGTIGNGLIAAGVTKIFTSIVDHIADNEGAQKRATERGDVDAAGAAAGEKAIQDGVNNFALAVAAGVGMWAGPAIGAIAGVAAKLVGQIPFLGDAIGHAAILIGQLFGGESLEAAVARARVEAGLVKIQKEFGSNAKAAAFALKEVEAGAMGIREAFASGVFDKNAANAVQVAQDAQTFVQEKEAQRPGMGRKIADWTPILGWFVDSVDEVNAQLDKEIEEMEKKSLDTRQQAVDDLQPAFKALATNVAVSNGSFEDFEKALTPAQRALLETESDVKGADGKNLTFLELQRQTTLNQIKATQENIKYLKSLNFGLTAVIGNAQALSGSLDRLVASQETGYNGFDQAASVLEQSLTSAAASMNPKDIELAQETLADTLRSYGADEEQVKQATESAKALTSAQSFAGDALKQAAAKLAAGGEGGPTKIKEEFSKQIEGELDNLGISNQTKKRILDSLGKVDFGSEEVQNQLVSGNFQAIIDQAFGPLSEEIKKQVLPALQERAKQEKVLIDLTRQKIQLEMAANEAKKKAIDIELEAAQAIADFGGRSVTTADKIDAANRQLNIDFGAAGLTTGGGTPRELANGIQQIQAGFNQIEVAKQTAAGPVAKGGARGAFGGVAGVEADKSEQLARANEALIDFSRKRIALIKEELDIIKKKNELEKSSLEKLLGGDVAGFFQDQAAAGAAVALRTGNTGLLDSFGASAIGAGFKSLEGQGLSDQQMRRASGAALSSLGITDTRSADILGGTTAEAQALKQEGQQFAQILGAAGQLQADVAEMRVSTQTVIIEAAKATMNEGAPRNALPTDVSANFARGGVVYANRGIFIPRGTDTVPAMLTPGEFVVNRAAVQRGNNLAILQAMNNGQQASGPAMARGGQVQYRMWGGMIDAISKTFESAMPNLQNIFSGFTSAVEKLTGMELSVKLDPTNVNVNFNGTSFLSTLTDNIREQVLEEVKRQIPNIQHSGTGGHKLDGSVMGR